jgi:hypothetical protein
MVLHSRPDSGVVKSNSLISMQSARTAGYREDLVYSRIDEEALRTGTGTTDCISELELSEDFGDESGARTNIQHKRTTP